MGLKPDEKTHIPSDVRKLLSHKHDWPENYQQQYNLIRKILGKKKVAPPDVLPEIVDLIRTGVNIVTLNENDKLKFYNTDTFAWDNSAKNIIRQIARHTVDNISVRSLNEVIDIMRTNTYVSGDIFDRQKVLVLKNGTLDLETYELKPHSPWYYATRRLSVEFNPKQDCLNIKKFLSEVTGKENIRILEEAMGYCLWPEYPYPRAFVLLGPTQTGKSTFLKLLGAFLGIENISALTMNQMVKRTFGLYKLRGKFANISPDMPEKAIYSTGLFKALTGDDTVRADVKFKQAITFKNTAKLWFQANMLPPSVFDDTDAYYGRWIIIDFPNQFLNNADPDLIRKLTTPEELTGLLNLALTGLKRLQFRGRFEDTIDLEAKKKAYLMVSDTIKAFINLECDVQDIAWIPKRELYSAYNNFCDLMSRSPIAYNGFTRKLKTWIPDLKTSKITERGERIPIYRGVGLPGGHLTQQEL